VNDYKQSISFYQAPTKKYGLLFTDYFVHDMVIDKGKEEKKGVIE